MYAPLEIGEKFGRLVGAEKRRLTEEHLEKERTWTEASQKIKDFESKIESLELSQQG